MMAVVVCPLQAGVRWVYFFQDTNAPAFKILPACLGVSKKIPLEVNSVCVPRKAGESIGGIMKLTAEDGRSMTVNVEYNQIDALLKATVEPRGDINGENGFSAYPGSINQLIFAMEPYAAKLKESGGGMPEFVNPKYTDSTKTAFKAPTRLECMMQARALYVNHSRASSARSGCRLPSGLSKVARFGGFGWFLKRDQYHRLLSRQDQPRRLEAQVRGVHD